MSIRRSKCEMDSQLRVARGLNVHIRFIECEKWRKEFGVDNLVRSFKYEEKPKVFEFYPQYYHKTDKVQLVTSNGH